MNRKVALRLTLALAAFILWLIVSNGLILIGAVVLLLSALLNIGDAWAEQGDGA
jgi:hypothetical protein